MNDAIINQLGNREKVKMRMLGAALPLNRRNSQKQLRKDGVTTSLARNKHSPLGHDDSSEEPGVARVLEHLALNVGLHTSDNTLHSCAWCYTQLSHC